MSSRCWTSKCVFVVFFLQDEKKKSWNSSYQLEPLMHKMASKTKMVESLKRLEKFFEKTAYF